MGSKTLTFAKHLEEVLRRIVAALLEFFRFTEEDARAWLLAYGIQVVELDRLHSSPDQQKETGGSPETISDPFRMDALQGTLLNEGRPNFVRQNQTTSSRNRFFRQRKASNNRWLSSNGWNGNSTRKRAINPANVHQYQRNRKWRWRR